MLSKSQKDSPAIRAVVAIILLATIFVPLPAHAETLEYAVASGYFFTQANGRGGAGGLGFAISDDEGIPFWSEFQSRGGVDALGYPVSQRFQWRGTTVQVLQKAVLQWLPEQKQVAFANIFDELRLAEKDTWLWQTKATPAQVWLKNESNLAWDDVVRQRQAFLDPFPAIKARYNAVPDPLLLYGLPASRVEDVGPAYVVRLQRAVMQQWKIDTAWARVGQITVANGGDVAKEAAMFPSEFIAPQSPSGVAEPSYATYSSGWSGYDISYPQKNGPYPSSSSYKFGIVGVNGGKPYAPNPYLAAEYSHVKATTIAAPSFYMNLSSPGPNGAQGASGPAGNCGPTDWACQSYNFGYNAAAYAHVYAADASSPTAANTAWWLDVETANYWSADAALNAKVISGAVDYFMSKTLTVGIYSIRPMWTKITGNYQFGSAVPNWVAGAPSLSAAPNYCAAGYSFSGGRVRLVQSWNGTYDVNFACP